MPPSAPSSTYTDNLVKHDHHQSTDNNRQSLSLIPRAAKKLLLTPSPIADNGTFTSMPSSRDASISLIEDNDYNERGENPVTPKSRSKKLLEKIVPSLKTTPHRPETPEMDPKAEQFFGKGSHERKKSHLFDKFKNKGKETFSRSTIDLINKVEGPARQIQFEEAPIPLRHKHSRLPADLTDSTFWDVKQAQKQRIHAIRDACIAENQQGGDHHLRQRKAAFERVYLHLATPPLARMATVCRVSVDWLGVPLNVSVHTILMAFSYSSALFVDVTEGVLPVRVSTVLPTVVLP